MLDAVEAGQGKPNEIAARTRLLIESEDNIRKGLFPDLYARRARNMRLLFDLLRQSDRASDLWLEARLLRLTERHDQCRQLCQSLPMYEWTFDVLQEFVWAGRGDSFPYERRSEFQDERDAATATQLFNAAHTLHSASCYQWQQAHDREKKLTPREERVSWRNGIGLFVSLVAAIVVWNVYSGWLAIVVFAGGAMLVEMIFGDDKEMVKKRMAVWLKHNPKPPAMRLSLKHEHLGPVGGGFPKLDN